MRVKAGEFQKEIPARYERAVELLTLADWEKPEKIRLTPMERFKFAEAAWRMEQDKHLRDHMSGWKPKQVVVVENREGEERYTVLYEAESNTTGAVVPPWVFRACPKDLVSKDKQNWLA